MEFRHDVSRFYDVDSEMGKDVEFYRSVLTSQKRRRLLDLGCGTGRALLALLQDAEVATGVDISEGMLDRFREKLEKHAAGRDRVTIVHADICDIDLGEFFDLIIAPRRVFQNLETDQQVDGLFAGIRRHLAPGGSCILNAYNPNRDREGILSVWSAADPAVEVDSWEKPYEDGTLRHSYRLFRFTESPLVLYPELIFRYRANGQEVDGARFVAPMRVYYPDEFRQTIESRGFSITGAWGGYSGETYGEGPELVLQFSA